MSGRAQQILAALALANLWLLFVWTSIVTHSPADQYLAQTQPGAVDYAAGLTAMAIVTAFLFLARRLASAPGRFQRPIRWGFLILLLVPANAIRDVLSLSFPLLRGQLLRVFPGWVAAALLLALASALAFGAWRWAHPVYHWVDRHLIFLSPALLVIAAALARAVLTPSTPFSTPAQRLLLSPPAPSAGRTVWIVLDELDQRLAFEDRPAGLALPELDALRRTSVWADDAHSPGLSTLTALPGLLLGRRVTEARAVGPNSLNLTFASGGAPLDWASQPGILDEMIERKWNSALVGWYHPYCRLFNAKVAECDWRVLPNRANSHGSSYFEIAPALLRSLFETSLFSPFLRSLSTQHHAANILALQKTARAMVANRDYQFVFLHLPGAHSPFPFDRRTGLMTNGNQAVRGYPDGLALADWTLGDLRRTLRASGLDHSTHLIVTSDHPFRSGAAFDGKASTRIPFLVHLAGQTHALRFSGHFSSLRTRHLVTKLLTGEVRTPSDVSAWMRSAATAD